MSAQWPHSTDFPILAEGCDCQGHEISVLFSESFFDKRGCEREIEELSESEKGNYFIPYEETQLSEDRKKRRQWQQEAEATGKEGDSFTMTSKPMPKTKQENTEKNSCLCEGLEERGEVCTRGNSEQQRCREAEETAAIATLCIATTLLQLMLQLQHYNNKIFRQPRSGGNVCLLLRNSVVERTLINI